MQQKFERYSGEGQSLSGFRVKAAGPSPTPERKVRVKQLCSTILAGELYEKTALELTEAATIGTKRAS